MFSACAPEPRTSGLMTGGGGDGRGGDARGRGRGRGTAGSNGRSSNTKTTAAAKVRCVVTTASTRRRLSLKKFNDVKRECAASLTLSKAVFQEARDDRQ